MLRSALELLGYDDITLSGEDAVNGWGGTQIVVTQRDLKVVAIVDTSLQRDACCEVSLKAD